MSKKSFLVILIGAVILMPSLLFAYGQSDLFRAASRGDTAFITQHLDAGVSVDTRDLLGNTLLHLAAENGQSDLAQTLIIFGANINKVNSFGYTPLFAAVANHQSKTATLLINAGADFSIKNVYGSTVMDFVKSQGYSTLQSYLNNADIKSKRGPSGYLYNGFWREDVEQLIKDKKIDEAIAKLITNARSGDADAQYLLGMLLYDRFRTAEAYEWLQKSANKGNTQAMYMAGRILTTEPELNNPTKGVQLLEKAASAGIEDAAVYTARAYIIPIGVKKDYRKAAEFLKKPLESNNPDAIYWKGVITYNGIDNATDNSTAAVTPNIMLGYEMIHKAASLGSQDARRHLFKFATEDTLSKIKNMNNVPRADTKTFFLSQNASLIESTDDCDSYSVEYALDPDFGVSDIEICYTDGTVKKTLKLSDNIDDNSRAWLKAFFANSDVVFDPSI